MAQELHHAYATNGSVSRRDIRDALASLTSDDLTEKSPVTAGVSEAGVAVERETVHVRVQDHDGEWSKTSEEAVRKAVESVAGVEELTLAEGGYDG